MPGVYCCVCVDTPMMTTEQAAAHVETAEHLDAVRLAPRDGTIRLAGPLEVGPWEDDTTAPRLVPRCDQCRFWTRRSAEDDDCWQVGEPAGTPEWLADYQRFGRCAKAETGRGNAKDVTSLALAVDYEKYHADLVTAESFGCVQWERKA